MHFEELLNTAELRLKMERYEKRVVIRVDGNAEIGGGHVFRCLTLAKSLRRLGCKVIFITRDLYAKTQIEQNGFCAKLLQSNIKTTIQDSLFTYNVMSQEQTAWLIFDGYHFDYIWEREILSKSRSLVLVRIDDLDQRNTISQILLNPTKISPQALNYAAPVVMTGPANRILRREFHSLRRAALVRRSMFVEKIERLIIQPGAFDNANLVPKVLKNINCNDYKEIFIIMSSSSQSLEASKLIASRHKNIRFCLDEKNVAKIVAKADACIGAGGMSAIERCSLGMPSVNFTVAKNQEQLNRELENAGAIIYGDFNRLHENNYLDNLMKKIRKNYFYLSKEATKVVAGNGADNLATTIMGTLIPVQAEDYNLIYSWRNHPHVLAASLDKTLINQSDHKSWFDRIMADPSVKQFFYAEKNKFLGYVRLEFQKGSAVKWSFYKQPGLVEKSVGSKMLIHALQKINGFPNIKKVKSIVREDNQTSIALHTRLGFRIKQIESEKIHFVKNLEKQ